jgi:UDP-N-acetyl-D-mannosaminuronic acid dehydrogenase
LEAAELVKLVDNTYRDVSFAFANEVAKLCGSMGLSASEVIKAGKLGYERTRVALPGPVGGPCLEKDPHILIESAAAYGVSMNITRAARQTNEEQPAHTIGLLKARTDKIAGFSRRPRIAVLGLAFKGRPATDDLRGTMAKYILEELDRHYEQSDVVLYDPVVGRTDAERYFNRNVASTLKEALSGADLAIIANDHMEFQQIELKAEMMAMNNPAVIYDYWNLHPEGALDIEPGKFYMALGSEGLSA